MKNHILPLILSGILIFAGNAAAQPAGPKADTSAQENELFLVAQKAFDDGFYDVAIRYIDQFLKQYPQSDKQIQAKLLLGQCHFFKSQYLKAFEIFQGLLQYSEFQDATLFWLGETYFKGADYKEAERNYAQLIQVYPNSEYVPQAYYSLGWTYFEQGDYAKAKKAFLSLIKKFPLHQLAEDAAFKLGESEQNAGNYENAVEYFKSYILKYPPSRRHADAYFYIAEAYYYLADYLSAVAYYAKSAEIAYDPKVSYMARIGMGWGYLKLEKADLAQKSFEAAETIATDKGLITDDLYLGLATLYAQTAQNEKALEAYGKLTAEFPDSPRIAEARLGLANIHYSMRSYEPAVAEYQKIIDEFAADPLRADIVEKAHYGLAWTYLKSGQIDASIKTFETIMSTSSNKIVKASALTQIGDAYQDIGQLDKALEVYDRILREFPDSMYGDYVQFQQGVTLLKQNKIEAATLSLQSLLTHFPESKYISDAKYYLAVAFFKKKDWPSTVEHVDTFLAGLSGPSEFTAESLYLKGLSQFNMTLYEKSRETFQKIVDEHPQDTEIALIARLNIAKCLHHTGKTDQALAIFQKIGADAPESETAQEAMLWVADYRLENGELDTAITDYMNFLERYPGSSRIGLARYELGQAYQAKGELDKAVAQYQAVKDTENLEIYGKAQLAIADIFSRDQDEESAVAAYQKIADSSEDLRRDAYIQMADIYMSHKKLDQVIQAYQQALATPQGHSDVSNAELLFRIADVHETASRATEAVDAYLQIPYLHAKETSWVVKAYLRIGRIFENQEKWDEARTTYTKIMDLKTDESKYAQERIEWINANTGAENKGL